MCPMTKSNSHVIHNQNSQKSKVNIFMYVNEIYKQGDEVQAKYDG